MTCGIIGDSIALGLALTSHAGCDVSAKVGRSASVIATHVLPQRDYDWVTISAGSNSPFRLVDLDTIRKRVKARKVVWIIPASPAARRVVLNAVRGGDRIVTFTAGRDGVHPVSYGRVWRDVVREIKR